MTSLRPNAAQMARVTCPCGNTPPLERPGKRTCAISPARSVAPVNCVTEITRAETRRFLHTRTHIHVRWDRASRRKIERRVASAISTFPAIIAAVPRRCHPGPPTTTLFRQRETTAASHPSWRNRGDVSVNWAAIKIKPTAWAESPELFLNTAQLAMGLSVE